jgi:uncharacterized protein
MSSTPRNPNSPLEPSKVAKFISLGRCERYFEFGVSETREVSEHLSRDTSDFSESFRQQNRIQKQAGDVFEKDIKDRLSELTDRGYEFGDSDEVSPVQSTTQALTRICETIKDSLQSGQSSEAQSWLLYQPAFSGVLGDWKLYGEADFVVIYTDGSQLVLHTLDAKMSDEEKSNHQLQTTLYSLLLEQTLSDHCDNFYKDLPFVFKTGVVTPNSGLQTADISFSQLPVFERPSRVTDIKNLLKPSGQLSRLEGTAFDELSYSIEEKCDSCPYSEVCLTHATEQLGLELLGISPRVQELLESEGVTSLPDLASLGEPPSEYSPTDTSEDIQLKRTTEVYDRLSTHAQMTETLSELVIEARTLLGEIDPNRFHADSSNEPVWHLRPSRSTLPEDSPPPAKYVDNPQYDPDSIFPFPRDSLIRVYVTVQYDNARQRIAALAATVDATAGPESPVRVSVLDTDLPLDSQTAAASEATLISDFFSQLTDAIESVQSEFSVEGLPPDTAPLHFYFFTPEQREILLTQIREHTTNLSSDSLPASQGGSRDLQQTGQRSSGEAQAEQSRGTVLSGPSPSLSRGETVSSVGAALPYYDLLSRTGGIDQPTVSILKGEVESRFALLSPTSGLVQLAGQFSSYEYGRKGPTDWTYTPTDSETPVNLSKAFSRLLFDAEEPYTTDPDGENKALALGVGENPSDIDGWAQNRYREGGQIPLPYIWGAVGRASHPDEERATGESSDEDAQTTSTPSTQQTVTEGHTATQKPSHSTPLTSPSLSTSTQRLQLSVARPFLYRDTDYTERITTEDIEQLLVEFTDALLHIERGISYRSFELSKHKHPISLSNLQTATFPLAANTLAESVQTFINLEFDAAVNETREHYQKRPRERLADGTSLVVQIDSTAVAGPENSQLEASASFAFGNVEGIHDPARFRETVRATGSTGEQSGTYLNAVPAGANEPWDPKAVESGVSTQVLDLMPDSPPDESDIRLRFRQPYYGKSEDDDKTRGQTTQLASEHQPDPSELYSPVTHKDWTVGDSNRNWAYKVSPGGFFFLDPQTDDIISEQTSKCLSAIENNDLYQTLEQIRTGDLSPLEQGICKPAAVEPFLSWLLDWAASNPENEYGLVPPNEFQQQFIKTTDSPLTLLQGAPGTGKTAGALGPAIVARVHSQSRNRQKLRTLVTGPSNKSVNEVLDDVHALVTAYRNHGGDELDNLSLVRITGGAKPDPEDQLKNVTYVSYTQGNRDESELADLQHRLLDTQLTSGTTTPSNIPHTIVFATPTRSWFLTSRLHTDANLDSLAHLEQETTLYDQLVVDEASMLELPRLLLAGAFTSGEHTLISGDHRQMPPVTQHKWSEEYRPGVNTFAPHLSTLNYCRLLRGDDLNAVDEKMREQLAVYAAKDGNPKVDIPLTQLPLSYRSHKELCSFLRNHIYSLDGLPYKSSKTTTIAPPETPTDGLEVLLAPDAPVVLLTYNAPYHRQSNPLEAELLKGALPCLSANESAGIVTPHNAQRGLLSRTLDDITRQYPDTTIDTVERFQGGERDVMAVSTTVSDPGYISDESEFLLNLNRINVALSRMKKKLIILAAKPIFEHIPMETEEYRQARIWKALARECGVPETEQKPEWNGTAAEFLGRQPTRASGETPLEVYKLKNQEPATHE